MGIEINRIVNLFELLQHGESWVDNNFKMTLQGVDARLASRNLIPQGNCIWILTSHITYWRTTVVNRLTGSSNPPPFKDFMLPDQLTEAEWKQTQQDFES